MEDFGSRFRQAVSSELRAERGRRQMTIADLVESSGLSKSSVLNYLQGKRDIPSAPLAQLCQALSISPTTLVSRAEKATEESPHG